MYLRHSGKEIVCQRFLYPEKHWLASIKGTDSLLINMQEIQGEFPISPSWAMSSRQLSQTDILITADGELQSERLMELRPNESEKGKGIVCNGCMHRWYSTTMKEKWEKYRQKTILAALGDYKIH